MEEFIPKAVKGGKYSGSISVNHFDFDTRLDLVEMAQTAGSNTKYIREVINRTEPLVQKVSLKRVSDGRKYASFKDLKEGPPDVQNILIELSTWMMQGDKDDEGNKNP